MLSSIRKAIVGAWEPQPESHKDQILSFLLFPALLSAYCHSNRYQHGWFARPQQRGTGDSFILVEGTCSEGFFATCIFWTEAHLKAAHSVSSKIMLHLTQIPWGFHPHNCEDLPLPMKPQLHPGLLPCSAGTVTWEFGRDNTGNSGVTHNAAFHNPKWEEICSPCFKTRTPEQSQVASTWYYELSQKWVIWMWAGNWAHLWQESTLLAFPWAASLQIVSLLLQQKALCSKTTTDGKTCLRVWGAVCIAWCMHCEKLQNWDFAMQLRQPQTHKSY